MKTIILAGGYATRLRPLSITLPKPLFPILDKPILDWMMEGLSRAGLKNIILSIRYFAEEIMGRYSTGLDFGVDVRYAREVTPLGDAGPLRLIHSLYGLDETFMVVNGDIFGNIDFQAVVDFHRRKGGIATVLLTKVKDPGHYGVAVLDSEGRIVKFVEKPKAREAPSNLANAGVYIFEPEVLKFVPENARMKLAAELMPQLLSTGNVFGCIHEGLWTDIGNLSAFLQANFDALKLYRPEGYVSPNAEVHPEAELLQPVYVSHAVRVDAYSKVGPYAVLGRDTTVGKTARVYRSVLFPSAFIDTGALVKGSIVGNGVVAGKWTTFSEGVVVGGDVTVADEVTLASGVIVFPYKELTESVEEPGKIIV
ncbi:NDP-sugar synthase [Candidatus Hecatella orcuttiae]|uniref:NDP-sugar synthase n=1 Tax=Candidatus Hecatella orcuttiae TaxID=1935119 RepID=UPI002867DC59|nr:NDP-sugar synthase [Candidatus Hecatella orcuttiae]